MIADTPYYTRTRMTDRLVLPRGAKITHAPRFETETCAGGDGWNSWAVAKTNGDIVVNEIRYKKRGKR